MKFSHLSTACLYSLLLAPSAFAGEPAADKTQANTLVEAITEGKASINFRYRAEQVDQANIGDQALASTLRTRLKYETKPFYDLSGVIEFENVLQLGWDDYNSTVNGKGQYPVIADPEVTNVNQAYLAYTGIEKTTLLAGRKAHNLNNQRFVGSVGFRQNDQTFDMAAIVANPVPKLQLSYGYVWKVNRIFGDDHPLGTLDTNTHVLNGAYKTKLGTLSAYGLLIDLKDTPVLGLSSQTYGVRLAGKHKFSGGKWNALYEGEYARQSDYEDNPTSYSADYYHVAGGLSASGLTAKIGYEKLGSDDGNASFKTPVATLHKFNGWADKFLATPANGLEDIYGALSYKFDDQTVLKGLKLDAIYHDFSGDIGGDYGTEIDLQASMKINKNYYGGLKYADYDASGFSVDTQKLWFTIGANY